MNKVASKFQMIFPELKANLFQTATSTVTIVIFHLPKVNMQGCFGRGVLNRLIPCLQFLLPEQFGFKGNREKALKMSHIMEIDPL